MTRVLLDPGFDHYLILLSNQDRQASFAGLVQLHPSEKKKKRERGTWLHCDPCQTLRAALLYEVR
ncbi:hypothetical protein PgNI_05698 [Pyricularia grisea]|uniref:Uncharacterized protein n=1 Tax=Pyricularia grisea TaxID=148305 RepID=A0A6P8B797_PYRGI|nr:hypothetical protein PgNI_05698 [Pyricularia grisea]TLD11206.1 hypothetical protein PgNI_05698 [Pyricularia grisea]